MSQTINEYLTNQFSGQKLYPKTPQVSFFSYKTQNKSFLTSFPLKITLNRIQMARKPSKTTKSPKNNKNQKKQKQTKKQTTPRKLNTPKKSIRDEDEKELKMYQKIMKSIDDPWKFSRLALDAGSMATYRNNMNAVISRISVRTGKPFTFTTSGLLDFMSDYVVADDISSSYCASIISAFKYIYKNKTGLPLPKKDETALSGALAARKRIVPDNGKVVGAITRSRLKELIPFIKKHKDLNNKQKELFIDTAVMLYGGCLRIFQLRELMHTSFSPDKKERGVYFVEVPIKGDRVNVEKKVLDHDEEISRWVLEIAEKRKDPNNRSKLLFSDFDTKMEKRFGEICKEASVTLKWPRGQHFQGTHMFRHGAVQDAAVERGLDWAQLRSGHESDKCLNLYAASDAQRERKLNKKGFKNLVLNAKITTTTERLLKTQTQVEKKHTIQGIKLQPLGADILERAEREHERAMQKIEELWDFYQELFEQDETLEAPEENDDDEEEQEAYRLYNKDAKEENYWNHRMTKLLDSRLQDFFKKLSPSSRPPKKERKEKTYNKFKRKSSAKAKLARKIKKIKSEDAISKFGRNLKI